MKITILKPLGDVGVITDVKRVISEEHITVNVTGAREGTLMIGQRAYSIKDGAVRIREYEITQGTSNVTLTTDNKTYFCGSLSRKGRFLEVINDTDKLVVSCAFGWAAQDEEIRAIKEKINAAEKQFGIKII